MVTNNGNTWSEYQKLVLHELRVLTSAMHENRKEHVELRRDIATLKVKSGIWGVIGGFVPIAVILIVWLIKNGGAGP